ncbi:hypothetical protein [Thioclava atlantica]|uniref:Uncharacterized protein n=1 Tax=Thioclava atlantica TaxID=1317124 RepID=A0A085TYP6_9RHOB|nr:hypothetical protein [Thioclava atlantica]KFE35843.1 hypothetical protein DW2_04420 [Thioclava atlantica]
MDRISGLMPQIGWSPLMVAATPKKAPATTVEPAEKPADAGGGRGANVDTQTPGDHARQVRTLEALVALRKTDAEEKGAGEPPDGAAGASPEAPPDPDAPTGPPPTFDVTPLEAQAAALREAPDLIASPEPVEAREESGRSEPETDAPEPAPENADAPPENRNGASREDWPRVAAYVTPKVDVTR